MALSTFGRLSFFKNNRRHTDSGMNPLPVIELLNILEKSLFRMFSVVKINSRKPFMLQWSEKRFGNRLVPTISFPAHALNKMQPRKCLPESITAILDTAVGMNHQAIGRDTRLPEHLHDSGMLTRSIQRQDAKTSR
jgi:hypothetical protein